jgi:hypothetical protein
MTILREQILYYYLTVTYSCMETSAVNKFAKQGLSLETF